MSAPPESESHRAGSPSGPQSHDSDDLRIPTDAELAEMSTEDLRELAMRQVPGDIVTLVSGALLRESSANTELSLTS